jgi:hypothetical protein
VPVSALESHIDDLYQAPLEEFTSRRNALAKTLSGADAQRVKKLPKPTVVPWAANQLYWKARASYDRLLESGERLRHAQLGALEGRAADIRAAADAHRKALSDAVKEAERVSAASGSRPAPDALMRTFEALSLMRHAPAPPGRLTEALQPAGFEALAGVPVNVRLPAPRAGAGTSAASVRLPRERDRKPDVPTPDPRKEAEARKREASAARLHEAEVKKAEAALARAKAAALLARDALDRADKAVEHAAAELKRLRA